MRVRITKAGADEPNETAPQFEVMHRYPGMQVEVPETIAYDAGGGGSEAVRAFASLATFATGVEWFGFYSVS